MRSVSSGRSSPAWLLGPRRERERDAPARRVQAQLALDVVGVFAQEALGAEIPDRAQHLVDRPAARQHRDWGAQPPPTVLALELRAGLGLGERARRGEGDVTHVRGAEVGEELLAPEVLDVVGQRLEEVVADDVRVRHVVHLHVDALTDRIVAADDHRVRLVGDGERERGARLVEPELGAVLGGDPLELAPGIEPLDRREERVDRVDVRGAFDRLRQRPGADVERVHVLFEGLVTGEDHVHVSVRELEPADARAHEALHHVGAAPLELAAAQRAVVDEYDVAEERRGDAGEDQGGAVLLQGLGIHVSSAGSTTRRCRGRWPRGG